MTGGELGLCLSSVMCSTISQLVMKLASSPPQVRELLGFLSVAAFATAAYLLAPIGSHFAINEHLLPRFSLGAFSIVVGIAFTTSWLRVLMLTKVPFAT